MWKRREHWNQIKRKKNVNFAILLGAFNEQVSLCISLFHLPLLHSCKKPRNKKMQKIHFDCVLVVMSDSPDVLLAFGFVVREDLEYTIESLFQLSLPSSSSSSRFSTRLKNAMQCLCKRVSIFFPTRVHTLILILSVWLSSADYFAIQWFVKLNWKWFALDSHVQNTSMQ